MRSALDWLEPLRSSIPELDLQGWDALERFADDLGMMTLSAPLPADAGTWSLWLMDVRRELAVRGHRAPSRIWQVLAQFVAGFQDLDLRDCSGPGHGALILSYAGPAAVAQWRSRLEAGEIVGIAATERHGGSRLPEITTRARESVGGRWRLTGEKTWIARLNEAAGFVVFFRDPLDRISAAVVEAEAPGLHRQAVEAAGLSGCSWGFLRFESVEIDPAKDLIGAPGDGPRIFQAHFSRFRPLVAATALGTAAGVHTLVSEALRSRIKLGILPAIRDSTLISIGRTYMEIVDALLGVLAGGRLAAEDRNQAGVIAQLSKGVSVDLAINVVHELAPMLGAIGFQQAHPVAKARADLTGLLYADGIHDALYRSGGRNLLQDSLAHMTNPSSR